MVGISEGGRKFAMQKGLLNWRSKVSNGGAPITTFNENEANPADWNLLQLTTNTNDIIPALVWNQTKMDLRAFNQGGKGLALNNATIQESAPVFQETMASVTPDSGIVQPKYTTTPLLIYDVLTTEKMNVNAIYNCVQLLSCPSFIPFYSKNAQDFPSPKELDSTDFNPSMVIYGMWRYFQNSTDRQEGLRVLQSSQFGMGETIVAPHVYWTRIALIPDIRSNSENQGLPQGDIRNYLTIPAANLVMQGDIVDLSAGAELAQMSRSVMR